MLTAVLMLQGLATTGPPVSIEEYLELRRPGAVTVAPDGRAVAFTVREPDLEANQYRWALYLWQPESGARRLAPRFADVRAPRWSRDGAYLAFISAGPSDRAAPRREPRLWLLQRGLDGDATPMAELPGAAIDYGWAPDGSLYVLVANAKGRERGFWRIQPAGEPERVWGGDPGIRDLAVSPNGRMIAFSTNRTGDRDSRWNYDLWVLDLGSRRARELTSRPGPEVAPVWSPDSRTIAFRAPQNPRYPFSQTELLSVAVSGGPAINRTDAFDRAVLEHVWPSGGDLIFTAAVGTRTQLLAVRADGAIEPLTGSEWNLSSPDAAPGGAEIYAVAESATEAPELWRLSGPEPERLTQLNARVRAWRHGRQEVIRWTAPDGLSIEGLLVYPAEYQEGRRYPLLVNLAAGPASRARDALDQAGCYQPFASQGYAVLVPNFRGSRGYGEGFATAKRADLAGGDLEDVLAGVDHAIELGVADSTRIALYGGTASSYGAYLTTWALTQSQRFNAAVAVFDASAVDAGLFPERLGGERERSPLPLVSRIRAPLLLIERGTRSLVSRARRIYSALAELGRPVDYVELPADGSEPIQPHDRLDLFFRELRWFDRYLKFGGAELFDFYLAGEWVPGPSGWRLRVVGAEPRAEYSGLQPDSGQYLEVDLAFQPDESAVRQGNVQALEIDPAGGVQLIGPDGAPRPFAGTVTEVFGHETLIMGPPGPIVMPAPVSGAVTTVAFRLAFEIPRRAAEYRLRVAGFALIRIWVNGRSP